MNIQSVQFKNELDLRQAVQVDSTRSLAAYTAIIGALFFIVGAVLWTLSGADIDQAVTNGKMAEFLTTAAANQSLIVANISFWIMGAILLGVAGTTMARRSKRPIWSLSATACYRAGVPLVIVSYLAMLAVTVQIAPDTSAVSVSLAEAIGWIGSRGDWIATILMVGLGPLFLSQAGRGEWAPNWLVGLGYVTGICGLLTAVAIFAGGLDTYGFIIIPVGLIWMIAAGLVLRRSA